MDILRQNNQPAGCLLSWRQEQLIPNYIHYKLQSSTKQTQVQTISDSSCMIMNTHKTACYTMQTEAALMSIIVEAFHSHFLSTDRHECYLRRCLANYLRASRLPTHNTTSQHLLLSLSLSLSSSFLVFWSITCLQHNQLSHKADVKFNKSTSN